MLRVEDTRSTLIERLEVAVDRGITGMFRGMGRYLMPQVRATGVALPIAPLLPGNAELANHFYRNRFVMAGCDMSGGTASIFAITPPSEAWAADLYGFSWLPHLAVGALEMHRAFARTVIGDCIARRRSHPGIARHASVRAHRIKTAVLGASFVLTGAAQPFREQFFAMISRDVAALSVATPSSRDRLPVAIALAYAATSLEGLEGLRPGAFERLESELSRQILADGGHISRNPVELLSLLIDLLPLRTSLVAGRQALPRVLNSAIERMLPMLRFFSHGDDGLAAFQGVTSPMMREVRAVLSQDSTLGRPLSHAPHSGYARLQQGTALALADIGNDDACTSPLAFEFSDGVNRIVVNCGLPSCATGRWRRAACQEAAHSTANAIEPAPNGETSLLARWFGHRRPMPKPRCTGRVTQSEHGLLLRSINHAFGGRPGDVHERDVFLSTSGNDLRGEDRFAPGSGDGRIGGAAAAVRFHLHPSVKATLSQDGLSIMLILANKSGWRFSARGGPMLLEESVYLLGSAVPRNSQQIVVRGTGQINWALKRMEKRSSRVKGGDHSPELPL